MYTMKKFSKFHLTALTLAGLMVVTTASVGAASVYKNITARQNTAMTVKVDGTCPHHEGRRRRFPLPADL